jgi:Family of unknown function (DUF6308)
VTDPGASAPEPGTEYESERREWRASCPDCVKVVFGESGGDAIDAWRTHVDCQHSPMPRLQLRGEELLAALADVASPHFAWAIWALRGYWLGSRFTGAQVDRLGFASDPRTDPYPSTITATDIVAVSMLGVNIPAMTAIDLLEDRAVEINGALALIPHYPLHTVEHATIGPGSKAIEMWKTVRSRKQSMGPTKTAKLLARKRPHLLPVYDQRIADRLTLPEDDWTWWWKWWQDAKHVQGIEDLRRAAATDSVGRDIAEVSLLRILDVAVWRYDRYWNPPPTRRQSGKDNTT